MFFSAAVPGWAALPIRERPVLTKPRKKSSVAHLGAGELIAPSLTSARDRFCAPLYSLDSFPFAQSAECKPYGALVIAVTRATRKIVPTGQKVSREEEGIAREGVGY